MKKFLALGLICLLMACGAAYKFPEAVTGGVVKDTGQVVYSPAVGAWIRDKMIPDGIVFTKHISSGSGSYSEYVSDRQNLYLSSTYEFIFNGRLIGYSEHNLKFYEVVCREGKFSEKELSPEEVSAVFPGLEIVKVSTADNGTLKIKAPSFGQKTVLLLNDTELSYYHYSFGDCASCGEPFKSVLTVDEPRELVFAHFGANNPLYPPLNINIIDR